MKDNIKVVIVGAGPAGLATAISLKNLGIDDIVVVEENKFPRYKCCAGYITTKTKKAYEDLGLNIDNVNYSLIKDFDLKYKFKSKLNIENRFLYTNRYIERVELDNAFFELAKNKGIDIRENLTISTLNKEESYAILSNGERLDFKYIVFSDGTSGFGSRFQELKKKNIALQLVFKSERKDAIEIHFGIAKNGYGWVSTYQGVTNVGLTNVFNHKINYKELFKSFLNGAGFNEDITNLKGAFTPIGLGKLRVGNMYFAGDCAGFCDPLTLSGLRYALRSGELVAKAIKEESDIEYEKYGKSISFKFKMMTIFQRVFYIDFIEDIVFNVLCRAFKWLVRFVFNKFLVYSK